MRLHVESFARDQVIGCVLSAPCPLLAWRLYATTTSWATYSNLPVTLNTECSEQFLPEFILQTNVYLHSYAS
jgi:hypothetical protein